MNFIIIIIIVVVSSSSDRGGYLFYVQSSHLYTPDVLHTFHRVDDVLTTITTFSEINIIFSLLYMYFVYLHFLYDNQILNILF